MKVQKVASSQWEVRVTEAKITVQLTPDDSNQNRFSLDFCHTFTVILPSVPRTLDNSNLPLRRSRLL